MIEQAIVRSPARPEATSRPRRCNPRRPPMTFEETSCASLGSLRTAQDRWERNRGWAAARCRGVPSDAALECGAGSRPCSRSIRWPRSRPPSGMHSGRRYRPGRVAPDLHRTRPTPVARRTGPVRRSDSAVPSASVPSRIGCPDQMDARRRKYQSPRSIDPLVPSSVGRNMR